MKEKDSKDPLYTSKDNKNTNINKLKHKLSKDSTSLSDSPAFKSSFTKKIVEKWNLKRTSIKKRTKTIQKIEKYVKELKNGTFLKNKVFDSDLLRMNNIPSKMKKLNSKGIQQVIKKMSLYLVEGYPPVNKSIVGSLDKILYDPYFQSSWFLQALYNPPKPIKVKIKDNHPKVTEYLMEKTNVTSEDKNKLKE